MRNSWVLIALLFFAAKNSSASQTNSELLVRLGGNDTMAVLSEMKLHPKEYVKLLVEQLSITSNTDKITFSNTNERKDDLRIIWSIRALRYLTGIQFSAPINTEASTEKKKFQFLLKRNEQGLKFFGVKMSTETIYLAPIDTQFEIIKNWYSWSCKNLDTHSFPDEVDINEWYF